MVLTKQYIFKHSTARGGWTKKQLNAIGVAWPPKNGWIKEVVGNKITEEEVLIFENRKK